MSSTTESRAGRRDTSVVVTRPSGSRGKSGGAGSLVLTLNNGVGTGLGKYTLTCTHAELDNRGINPSGPETDPTYTSTIYLHNCTPAFALS